MHDYDLPHTLAHQNGRTSRLRTTWTEAITGPSIFAILTCHANMLQENQLYNLEWIIGGSSLYTLPTH